METQAAPTEAQRAIYLAARARFASLHHKILLSLSRDDVTAGAKHLGLLRKKTVALDNEQESTFLWDYLVYSYRPRGFNSAELYLRTHREELDPDTINQLEHMSRARYSVFRVESVATPGVHITEVLTNTPALLLDESLAGNGRPGLGVAGHLVPYDDFVLQSGAALAVDENLINSSPAVVRAWHAVAADDDSRTDVTLRSKLARALIATGMQAQRAPR